LTNGTYNSITPDDHQSGNTQKEEQKLIAAHQQRENAAVTLLTPMSKTTDSTPTMYFMYPSN